MNTAYSSFLQPCGSTKVITSEAWFGSRLSRFVLKVSLILHTLTSVSFACFQPVKFFCKQKSIIFLPAAYYKTWFTSRNKSKSNMYRQFHEQHFGVAKVLLTERHPQNSHASQKDHWWTPDFVGTHPLLQQILERHLPLLSLNAGFPCMHHRTQS